MMQAIIEAAIDRARTVILALLFLIIAGIAAYQAIPKESNPDITIANISVTVNHVGISPQDAERLLIRPAEKKLITLEGVKEVKSYANEGSATMRVEFEPGFDSDEALRKVREKIDEVKPEWPEDSDEPIIAEEDFNLLPVINILLTGDAPERTMLTVARNLRDKLEGLPQVLQVSLSGNREDVLEIIVDPLVLESYGLSPADVLETVKRNNVIVAAGELDTGAGAYSIKVPGLIKTLEDLQNVPVKIKGDTVITFKDVATIRRTFKERTTHARVGGKVAIGIGVSKRAGENIIDTVEAVKAMVAKEVEYWPTGINITYSQDTSTDIREMLADLQNNVIFGILLVMIVVIAIMGLRTASLVAIAIPASALIGILCLHAMGMTMNIVVLFSLILAVGMLVDDAIVVSEYADRKMVEGYSPKKAYILSTTKMVWPVLASTLTRIVVFMPLLFWPDFIGEFMRYLPLTMILTLTASLVMALVFIPTLGAFFGKSAHTDPEAVAAMHAKETGDYQLLDPFTRGYVNRLSHYLERPFRFTFSMLGLMVLIYVLYFIFNPGVEFLPDVEPRNAVVTVRGQSNLSLEEKDTLIRKVEKHLLGIKDIRVLYTRSGKVGLGQDEIGNFQLEFVGWQHRRKADEILQEVREKTAHIPGIKIETSKQEGGPPSAADVQIEVSSRFPELLNPTVDAILERMRKTDGLVEIRDDRSLPEIEWELNVNRELAGQYGLNVSVIGNFVKLVTNGIKASEYRPDDVTDEVDIMLRFPPKNRSISQLDRLKLYSGKGEVPISNFVTRTAHPRVSQIKRIDGLQVVNITANVAPGIQSNEKVSALQAEAKALKIDPNVNVRFRGESEDQAKTSAFLVNAFLIALFMVLIVLITEFNSIYAAFIIMSAIFFSTGGVLLGFLITQQPFGIVMCGVAVIALAGIIVNNNIIFIDTYQHLLREGRTIKDALLCAGAQRIRPILLTAGTAVLGLLPMVFGMNINFMTGEITFGAPASQWWRQLSVAIAFGLSFATILTLFFTPTLLVVGNIVHEKLARSRLYRRIFRHRAISEPPVHPNSEQ